MPGCARSNSLNSPCTRSDCSLNADSSLLYQSNSAVQDSHEIPDRQCITSLSLDELFSVGQSLGLKSFQVRQLTQWLYHHFAHSFDEMTNLSKDLRRTLQNHFLLQRCSISATQVSRDGSRKYLVSCPDGTTVETVAMPSDDGRLTVCLSTQAGCAIGCAFCATGHAGFTRSLSAGEMVDQVLLAQADINARVSNVVFMGQGEPFMNYANTVASLEILNSPLGLNIGARRLTVSTSGIIYRIRDFSFLKEQYGLALSLHSALPDTRRYLMPGVKGFSIPDLKQALYDYYRQSGRRPTIEYALIDRINTDDKHVDALIDFNRGLNAFINLINLNKVEGSAFAPVSTQRATQILNALRHAGFEVAIRQSRGQDIDAACGQLANKAQR